MTKKEKLRDLVQEEFNIKIERDQCDDWHSGKAKEFCDRTNKAMKDIVDYLHELFLQTEDTLGHPQRKEFVGLALTEVGDNRIYGDDLLDISRENYINDVLVAVLSCREEYKEKFKD